MITYTHDGYLPGQLHRQQSTEHNYIRIISTFSTPITDIHFGETSLGARYCDIDNN